MSKSCSQHKHNGSTYMLVLVVFIFVSVFSALMLSNLGQTIFQTNTYEMQMRCYYMYDQAAKATVAALLKDDNELLNSVTTERTQTIEHKDESGEVVGRSTITIKKDHLNYYGENAEWIVGEITTTITDLRAVRAGEDFSYEGTVMVLVSNPLIQLFNMNPEQFK